MASFTMKYFVFKTCENGEEVDMGSSVCGTPLSQRTTTKAAVSRMPTVVRASSEETSRRAFLSAVVGGAALLASRGAEAIDISDDRKVIDTGYYIIDEARDYSLPQSTRDGLDQLRGDLPATKKRLADAIASIKQVVPVSIEKNYWVKAREGLRLQAGTMRFDLNTIASSLGDRASQKAARKKADNFFVIVEELDNALRKKDQEAAVEAYQKTVAALDTLNLG